MKQIMGLEVRLENRGFLWYSHHSGKDSKGVFSLQGCCAALQAVHTGFARRRAIGPAVEREDLRLFNRADDTIEQRRWERRSGYDAFDCLLLPEGRNAMLKTIFLDLDDTILDFHQAEKLALSRTLRQFGVEPAPEVLDRYHVLNRQQWELLEEGKLTRSQVLTRRFDLLFAELGLNCSSREVCDVYEVFLSQGHFFMPGALELLQTLAPRYDLYLASNGAAMVQRGRLDSAGIRPYFKDFFISEEMEADKPSPAYFQAAFDAIPGFSRETALMVGDSLTSDIRGGRDAGLRTCWYNPGGLPPRPDIVPDYTIHNLAQLPALLETL